MNTINGSGGAGRGSPNNQTPPLPSSNDPLISPRIGDDDVTASTAGSITATATVTAGSECVVATEAMSEPLQVRNVRVTLTLNNLIITLIITLSH